jgi:hypothetical protein
MGIYFVCFHLVLNVLYQICIHASWYLVSTNLLYTYDDDQVLYIFRKNRRQPLYFTLFKYICYYKVFNMLPANKIVASVSLDFTYKIYAS